LVSTLIEKNIVDFYNDTTNVSYKPCPDCGGREWNDSDENGDVGDTHKSCDDCGYTLPNQDWDNLEYQDAEIFEWYVVTDWLASKLEENGECILKSDCETWWGRQCTGQAVYMDDVISKIVEQTDYANNWNQSQK
jgi:predicted RNA-binding Zn-ribbon protein involved in translation (DUF1610 family)